MSDILKVINKDTVVVLKKSQADQITQIFLAQKDTINNLKYKTDSLSKVPPIIKTIDNTPYWVFGAWMFYISVLMVISF